jgi:hypothetical protein
MAIDMEIDMYIHAHRHPHTLTCTYTHPRIMYPRARIHLCAFTCSSLPPTHPPPLRSSSPPSNPIHTFTCRWCPLADPELDELLAEIALVHDRLKLSSFLQRKLLETTTHVLRSTRRKLPIEDIPSFVNFMRVILSSEILGFVVAAAWCTWWNQPKVNMS